MFIVRVTRFRVVTASSAYDTVGFQLLKNHVQIFSTYAGPPAYEWLHKPKRQVINNTYYSVSNLLLTYKG